MPPYLLIIFVWWLSAEAEDRARLEDSRSAEVLTAVNEYNIDQNHYEAELDLRRNCIREVHARNNNIQNWHDLYDFLSLQGPEEAEFAAKLQADFDAKPNNKPLSIEGHCAEFPEPTPVEIPPILIEEGLVNIDD